ncbi:MAG: hypothetical protein IPM70_18700 [Proteobacteria bacterium]|nr:hypothetical protein [Pseudomonadota bacterium]
MGRRCARHAAAAARDVGHRQGVSRRRAGGEGSAGPAEEQRSGSWRNKKHVFDFWRIVYEGGHMERAPEFMAPEYIQQ